MLASASKGDCTCVQACPRRRQDALHPPPNAVLAFQSMKWVHQRQSRQLSNHFLENVSEHMVTHS
jgi:hypothetical protein